MEWRVRTDPRVPWPLPILAHEAARDSAAHDPNRSLGSEEREAQFVRNMCLIRRDFGVIDETTRPDVTLELPGSSWLAGTYRVWRR